MFARRRGRGKGGPLRHVARKLLARASRGGVRGFGGWYDERGNHQLERRLGDDALQMARELLVARQSSRLYQEGIVDIREIVFVTGELV